MCTSQIEAFRSKLVDLQAQNSKLNPAVSSAVKLPVIPGNGLRVPVSFGMQPAGIYSTADQVFFNCINPL
jgi:hypothetical protein